MNMVAIRKFLNLNKLILVLCVFELLATPTSAVAQSEILNSSKLPDTIGLVFPKGTCEFGEDKLSLHKMYRDLFQEQFCPSLEAAVKQTFEHYVLVESAITVPAGVDLVLTGTWIGRGTGKTDGDKWDRDHLVVPQPIRIDP